MSIQTKNEIKNRMVKKAAELWGVTPNEIESTFDPVVSLLIGACASELAKISNEVNASQKRITEKLIELMTPETSFGAQPAHAIAHAAPTEANNEAFPTHQLYVKKKLKNAEGGVSFKTVYFSPIRKFKLINAHISHCLVGDSIISFSESKKTSDKEYLAFKSADKLPNSTVYLGITPSKEKISLQNTSLFFELNDVSNQEIFYNQLKQAEFYFNDAPLEVDFGYEINASEDQLHLKKVYSEQSQKTTAIEQQALVYYKKHFVTISSNYLLNKKTSTLPFLENIDLSEHEEIENLHWIKVVFPTTISNSVLSNIYTSFNTFPVLNRRLESVSYQLKEFTNIVPFNTTDLFLDIRKITNSNGNTYKILDDESSKKGSYTLRDENVGQLDSNRAKDHLVHLIDLLKNESAAFSILGSDFLQTSINKLNQDISALENRVGKMSDKSDKNHYISVKPFSKKETVFVDFWSTVGEDANLIRSNTSLRLYKGADIDAQKCFLVTPTLQGKNTLTTNERLYKYRRLLLSRERIVTKEDVKALCFDVCGDKIKDVTLRKEFVTHTDYSKGLVPTLMVNILKNESSKVKQMEWEMIKSNILSILEEKSTNVLPYQVKIS